MTAEDRERIRRLQAAEMHEATPETGMVNLEEWDDRYVLTASHYELVVMKDDAVRPIRCSGVNIQTMDNLIAFQALLQRAQSVMKGGG
jgi:hypothetical protein